MVSRHGIKIDPEKIKAITKMPTTMREKEIQGFLGRINFISRFISQLTDKCEPIFKLLRKGSGKIWNEDCQGIFDTIKKYILNLPVLVPPELGRPLLLYLSVLDNSMGCVMGQHDKDRKSTRLNSSH